jgi:hypothetical protein
MNTTSIHPLLPAWSTVRTNLRSVSAWASHLSAARLLHTTAATVTTALAVLAVVNAAAGLYRVVVHHDAGRAGAVMFTAAVLGLYTAVTASAWRARLHSRRLSAMTWALWWIAVGIGVAATAAVPGSHTWVTRAIAAVPMATLAAVTVLLARPTLP